MNKIKEWFCDFFSVVEQADGTIEPSQELEIARLVQMRKETVAKLKTQRQAIKDAWNAEDAIKLRCVRILWANNTYENLFMTYETWEKIFEEVVTNIFFVLFECYTVDPGEVLFCTRSKFIESMLLQPEDYVLFKGRPVLVPEEQK